LIRRMGPIMPMMLIRTKDELALCLAGEYSMGFRF
jgi:hypothetical protein